MRGMHNLGLPMTVSLEEYSVRTVLPSYPLYLAGDSLSGFIPGDSPVFASPSILRITFPVGVPVRSLQGIFNPVRRIYALFVSQPVRIGYSLHRRPEGLAPGFNRPLAGLLGGILFVVM